MESAISELTQLLSPTPPHGVPPHVAAERILILCQRFEELSQKIDPESCKAGKAVILCKIPGEGAEIAIPNVSITIFRGILSCLTMGSLRHVAVQFEITNSQSRQHLIFVRDRKARSMEAPADQQELAMTH